MIIGISGSATPNGSTDILIKEVIRGASVNPHQSKFIRLNESKILPCQACGKSPEPELCFFRDDAYKILQMLTAADAIILGSPIYFDSVSAQTKLFIDRSNCLRPADFSKRHIQTFQQPKLIGKKGGFVLVAGDYGKFDSALKVMRAFFIWAGIEIKFELTYRTKSLEAGEAGKDADILSKAYEMGKLLGRQ